jgi:hypothetical protein
MSHPVLWYFHKDMYEPAEIGSLPEASRLNMETNRFRENISLESAIHPPLEYQLTSISSQLMHVPSTDAPVAFLPFSGTLYKTNKRQPGGNCTVKFFVLFNSRSAVRMFKLPANFRTHFGTLKPTTSKAEL